MGINLTFFSGGKKMKRLSVILSFFCLVATVHGVVILNDGGHYLIETFVNDSYEVDYQSPNIFTHLEVGSGGAMNSAYMYEDSLLTVSGGNPGYIYGFGRSNINVKSGGFERISIDNNSQVEITGCGYGNSISLAGNSLVKIYGTIFEINGSMIEAGEYTAADFTAEFDLNYSIGQISNEFHMSLIENSTLILVPEPVSFLILSFGVVFIRKL